jgi:phosphatidylglycerophosphate synthase
MTQQTQHPARERRPLKVRDLRLCNRAADALAAAGITPNMISVVGVLVGIMAGVALAATSWAEHEFAYRLLWLAGAGFIVLRGAANVLDGVVALETGQASPVGRLYNEVPDRVSDAAALIGAGYAVGGDVALGYVAASVALFVAYLRALGKAEGAGQDYCGPMAKPQRMFVITLAALYCGLTPMDWQPTTPWLGWGVMALGLWIVIIGGLLTSARRLTRLAAALEGSAP